MSFTLTSALIRTLRLFGDRPAIIDTEGQFSWNRFGDRVARAAGVLRSLGVNRGDRFGLIARNSFPQAELFHAGYWMGAIPVPVNYRLAPAEMALILDDADCGLLAVEDHFAGVVMSEALAPWAGNVLLVASPDGPEAAGADWPLYEARLAEAEPAPPYDADEDDDALLLYTGGTTGRPKGVRLSHRNIIANGMQTGYELRPHCGDVYLHVPPMFHAADLVAVTFMMSGSAHVYLPRFTGQRVLEAIQRFGVTVVQMTPTMLIMTVQEPDIASFDLSALRMIFYGSAPMDAEWIKRVLAAFDGVEIVQSYGLTETAPILTVLPMADHVRALESGEHARLRSCGRPLRGVDLRIVGDGGAALPAGEPGEIVVRAPNVTRGYLNRPEATAAALRGGWLRTGDIGRMDEHGYLYLLDRKRDMVITGGENVYTSEVEAVLYRHAKVHECAVVGVPDETYGEALLAAVVAVSGERVTAEELIAHCRDHIGGFKIPRRYVFLDELPRSAMNKVLKNELRRAYRGGADGGAS